MPHKYLLKEFEDFSGTAATPEILMQHLAQRIHMHIPRYNWVGFYLTSKKDSSKLTLGPYTGSFTPNATISLSQGLCGSAATTGRVVAVDNVAEDPRYIQVSDMVKSQIVVPIVVAGKVVAVLNVESYFMSAFKPPIEREFVETIAKIVAKCFAKNTAMALVHA